MIVLKILLWILLAVLGLIVLVLVLPVRAEVSYIEEKLRYKVKFWLLPVLDSDGGGVVGWLKKRKAKPDKPEKKKKRRSKKDGDVYDFDDAEDPFSDDFLEPSDYSPPEPEEPSAEPEAPEEEPSAVTSDESAFDEPEHSPITAEEKAEADKADGEELSDSGTDDEEKEEKPGKSLGEKIEFILDIWRAADRPLLKIFKGFKFYDIYIDFIIADEDAYKCALNYGRISGLVYNGLAFISTLFTARLKTIDVNAGFALEKSRWDAAAKLSFRAGTVVIAGLWFLITYLFRYFIPGKLESRKIKKAAARQK